MNSTVQLFLFLTMLPVFFYAQEEQVIRLKKEQNLVFFQEGDRTDTVGKGRGDVFRMVIPDSISYLITITIENAKLENKGKDNLFRLIYVPGHQYEIVYEQKEIPVAGKNELIKKRQPVSGINGSSSLEISHIRIRITDKQTGGILLENLFVYSRNIRSGQ